MASSRGAYSAAISGRPGRWWNTGSHCDRPCAIFGFSDRSTDQTCDCHDTKEHFPERVVERKRTVDATVRRCRRDGHTNVFWQVVAEAADERRICLPIELPCQIKEIEIDARLRNRRPALGR